MQPYKRSRKKLLFLILPLLVLLVAGTTYAAINLTAQKPTQHSSLKPGINLAQGEKGLVGWWKLNGDAKDSTPYADNGTLVNNPTPTTDRKGTANGAMSFNGTSQYITVPDSPATDPTTSLSISAWIYPTSIASNTNYNIFSKDVFASHLGYRLYLAGFNGTANQVSFTVANGTTRINNTTAQAVPANQWSFVTATFSSSTLKVYINGVLAQSMHGSVSSITNTGTYATIGRESNGGEFFPGSISDVRLYNRALSPQDITNLYNSYNSQVNLCATAGGSCTVNLSAGLIGYWPFSGNAKDATPYGNNGTVNGATLTTNRFGAPNTAYAFNGSGDYIAIPSSRFNLTNNFSLAAWIYANPDTGVNYAIISSWRSQDGGQDWWFHRQRSGLSNDLSFQIKTGRSQVTSTGTPINANTWYYVTFVLNSGVAKLYVNGSLAATSFSFGSILSGNTGGLRIGGTNPADTTAWFNGSIDQVRVYNRPLNAAEVQALYNLPD